MAQDLKTAWALAGVLKKLDSYSFSYGTKLAALGFEQIMHRYAVLGGCCCYCMAKQRTHALNLKSVSNSLSHCHVKKFANINN